MVEEFGGFFVSPDNVRNLSALEYILDAVRFTIFGHTLYSTLKEKAAAIADHIISRHVFHDGSKRTATHVAWSFLRANGIQVSLDPSIIELTEAVAKSEASYDELFSWLHNHQET